MFDHLYKKIKNSITIAIVSVLIIECATVFFAYSFLNIRDYTKKTEHFCNQISTYIELRLRSYEESTNFFISNNNFESLIKTNSPKTLSLFSQFIASNIGIKNVFIYDDNSSISYENNYYVSQYINEKQKSKQSTKPFWDVYTSDSDALQLLMYSYPIKSNDSTIAHFVICISPELLSDNTIRRYENSMSKNTISFVGTSAEKYCSIDQESNLYSKVWKLYSFSQENSQYFDGYFRVSNSVLKNCNLYIQTFVSFKSVLTNILIMGIIIFMIVLLFSFISYIIIKSYSTFLVEKLSYLTKKIANFSKKDL